MRDDQFDTPLKLVARNRTEKLLVELLCSFSTCSRVVAPDMHAPVRS